MLPLNKKAQRGAAIIVALFVTALVAACAVAMMFRLHINIHRTELITNADKANLYAQGSVDWAIQFLQDDVANQKPDQIIDKLPVTVTSNAINGYTITSIIEDMQNKININDLQDIKTQAQFNRLVHLLLPKLSAEQIIKLVNAIFDWTFPGSPDTSLKQYYAKLTYPYQAPHKPMTSISELRLVRGVTPTIYQTLLPFVSALPVGSKVNVNNASWEILYSLSPNMTAAAAKTVNAYCKLKPFPTVEAFRNFDIIKNVSFPENIDVNSSYFLLKTSVKVNDQQILLYTLLARTPQDKNVNVKIIWQSKGTL